MAHQRSRTSPRAALACAMVATLLAGCTFVPPEPIRWSLFPARTSHVSCEPSLARAHTALAMIGSTPESVHEAHVQHAVAMAEYHSCLATSSAP